MNDEQEREYRALCREMRAWPAELAARLGNAPPIGLHFFIRRELTQPSCYAMDTRPLEEPLWDRFQAANKDRVVQAKGGREKWDKLPGDMGRFRFFGQVSHEELERIAGIIMEVLKNADDTISKCQQLPVEPWRAWKFGGQVLNHPFGHRLTEQHRLLGLISLATGYDYDGIELLVQEDEYDWPLDTFTPYDQEFVHEPWDGVRIAVDAYALQDFVAAFTQAVNKWITEEIELGVSKEDAAEAELPEEDEAESEDKPSDLPKRPSPTADDAPIVKSITARMLNGGLVFTTRGRRPVSVPPELEMLFSPFLSNIANGNPGRVVQWVELHKFLGKPVNNPTKASYKSQHALGAMRDVLAQLGQPPDRKLWIGPVKASKGCRLNVECNWWADKAVLDEYTEHLRGLTDPKDMERNTSDRKLPAQRPHERRKSDDDQ